MSRPAKGCVQQFRQDNGAPQRSKMAIPMFLLRRVNLT
ncbi:hypothetical protein [Azospirillum largimobile]